MIRFRLIDAVVTIAIAAALLGVTVSARQHLTQSADLYKCRSNLQQIAQALVLYQGVNDGAFPRTRYDPAAPLTAFTAADAPDPFSVSGPSLNDTSAAMFLLAREMELPPDTFICPSAQRNSLSENDDYTRVSAKQRSNFRGRINDNYSLANMYPDAAAVAAGYSLDHFLKKLPATFAIAADTNPGLSDEAKTSVTDDRIHIRFANSPNHQRDGQNVLMADGSVGFLSSPFANLNPPDDIYRGNDGGPQPRAAYDSVLLPTWADGPQDVTAQVKQRRWVLVGAMILVFAVLTALVIRGVKRPVM